MLAQLVRRAIVSPLSGLDGEKISVRGGDTLRFPPQPALSIWQLPLTPTLSPCHVQGRVKREYDA